MFIVYYADDYKNFDDKNFRSIFQLSIAKKAESLVISSIPTEMNLLGRLDVQRCGFIRMSPYKPFKPLDIFLFICFYSGYNEIYSTI